MQTAKSILKFKVPVSIVEPLSKKQVVVLAKQLLQTQKPVNAKLTRAVSVNPNASSNKAQDAKVEKEQIKAEKTRILSEQQKAAYRAKVARWKDESKQTLKLLQTKYPLCFSIPAKPFAIGISKEVIVLEKDNFLKQQIEIKKLYLCSHVIDVQLKNLGCKIDIQYK